MTDSSAPGRAILKTIQASLRLARNSSEILTISQLLAMESSISETLAIVSGQIRAERSNGCRIILNVSDWDDTSDEEKEGVEAVGRNPPNVSQAGRRSHTEVAAGKGGNGPRLPGPYPTTPPEMAKLPTYWYVISRGTEVGIFTDKDAVINAVTIIARHQVRVKTWLEAATLYNGLYHEGKIFRVHG